jgi:O-antigen/teichoic acid export membrane protein
MGPDVFGQYALITSISMWFALMSGLGATSMMTRSVTPFVLRDDRAGLRKLVSGLLTWRAATGLVSATVYFTFTSWWLEFVSAFALLCVAGSVFSRTVANVCFALFLGLNRAARWGLGEFLRRWLALAFVLTGFLVAGLDGAAAGFLAAHVSVLAVGVWMARGYIDARGLVPDRRFLVPFLRTGAVFAGGNLLLALSQRTGETLVHASTGAYDEVGFFGVAYGLYLAGAQALWHVAMACAPVLVRQHERGDGIGVRTWLEHLLTVTTVAASASALLALCLAEPAVDLVLGPAYAPAAPNVAVLAVALVAVAASSIGRLHALVGHRPGVSAAAAAVDLATFWTLGPWLAARYGSLGACVAVLVAASLNAVVLGWRRPRADSYSHRKAGWVVVCACLVAPIAGVRTSWPTELALAAAGLAAFGALLGWGGLVSLSQIATLYRALGNPDTRGLVGDPTPPPA